MATPVASPVARARGAAVGSVEALLRVAAGRLRARAGSAARLEAEVLLAHVLDVDRARLPALDAIDEAVAASFERLLDQRERDGRPIAYLVGRREFRDRDFSVDERVLVPRPETELLLDVFEELLGAQLVPEGPVVDWGTGSGALAACLEKHRPVVALDASAAALEVATLNLAAGHGPRLLVRSDGATCLRPGSVAAVVANPPYVTPEEYADLDVDVLHEPRSALVPADGDVVGLYSRIAAESLLVLCSGGWLLSEVGAGQAASVERNLLAQAFTDVVSHADLAGIPRVVVGRAPVRLRSRPRSHWSR